MGVLNVEKPAFMAEEDIAIFEDAVGKFFDEHAPEAVVATWRKNHVVDREMWNKAGRGRSARPVPPEEYGGAGGDYRHEAVLMEQLGLKGVDGFGISLHNAIVMPPTSPLRHRGAEAALAAAPGTGELVGHRHDRAGRRLGPAGGEDHRQAGRQPVRDQRLQDLHHQRPDRQPDHRGGQDRPDRRRARHLVADRRDRRAEGFERGRNLDKLGHEAQDTSELFFNDVKVPTENLLGTDEGQGFFQLMGQLPQERLNIAVQGMATIERALELTIAYVKDRKAFGKAIIDFQNTQFVLAECKTEATVAKVFVNHCIEQHLAGKLDAATASMAKYWVSDLENKIVDRCLQLFGGYGFMNEYPIARMYRDSRVQRIYGGTNEIMKLLIARTL
jgi:acyl-CoA dehydrogenase